MSIAVADRFEHIGFLYGGMARYTEGCAAFLRRGLSSGDPVMVAVPAVNGDCIRDALGDDAAHVQFADMKTVGRNPGRIIPWVLHGFAAAHPDRRVWIIGEPVWPGRTPMEYPACGAHEALINTAFTGHDAAILCPYDTGNLDPAAVDDAWRTHPVIADESGRWTSLAGSADPVAVAATFNRALPLPPADAVRRSYDSADDLAGLRAAAALAATAAGLAPGRVQDLMLAVTELAANTVEHTESGRGVLSMWTEPGMLVCQIDDTGHLLDPMAGRVLPAAPGLRGRGLVLVNRLVDLLRTYTDPDGTSIRIHLHTPGYQPA